MSKFKVGDKVVVNGSSISGMNQGNGRVAVIDKDYNDGDYRVQFSEGFGGVFNNSLLTLLEEKSVSKFKVGDIVTGTRGGQVLSRGRTAEIIEVTDSGYHVKAMGENPANSHPGQTWYDSELKLVKEYKKSMDNLQQGDVLVSDNSYKDDLVFQGKIGDMFGFIEDDSDSTAVWLSKTELENSGYKLKDAESEQTEVTLEEIADKFGIDVKELRIKE